MTSPVTSTYDLTTIAAVVQYLGGPPTVTSDSYPLLQALITAISRECATYCSRDFRLQDYDEVYSGQGSTRIILNQSPVLSVTAVSVGGVAIPASTGQQRVGFTNADRVLYYRGGAFCNGIQNVGVTFSAGYLTPGQAADMSPPMMSAVTVPQDLAQSIIEAVALRWRRIPNEDKASIALGDQSTSFVTAAIPATVKPVWDAYKFAMLW